MVLEKTLESPLDCREIKPVNPPWIFIGRTDAEAEGPVLWPFDAKSRLIGKDSDAGKCGVPRTKEQEKKKKPKEGLGSRNGKNKTLIVLPSPML